MRLFYFEDFQSNVALYRFHGSSEIRMGNLVSYVKGVKSQIDVHLFRHIDRRLFSCSFY